MISSLGLAKKRSRSSSRPSACALAVPPPAPARSRTRPSSVRGCGTAKSDHELRLADAGWPQQQQGFAMRYPAASGELADLPRIERRLGGKVEAVEGARSGEVSDVPRHLDAPLVLARDLALEQKKGQRLAEGQLAPGGLVQQNVEPVADRR
jgi:hypothetical protein